MNPSNYGEFSQWRVGATFAFYPKYADSFFVLSSTLRLQEVCAGCRSGCKVLPSACAEAGWSQSWSCCHYCVSQSGVRCTQTKVSHTSIVAFVKLNFRFPCLRFHLKTLKFVFGTRVLVSVSPYSTVVRWSHGVFVGTLTHP